jgi:hypothetical protein
LQACFDLEALVVRGVKRLPRKLGTRIVDGILAGFAPRNGGEAG